MSVYRRFSRRGSNGGTIAMTGRSLALGVGSSMPRSEACYWYAGIRRLRLATEA